MNNHLAFSEGNVAVITGAANGIGLAAAERFAALGMNVLMSDINTDLLEKTAIAVREIATPLGATVDTRSVNVAEWGAISSLKDYAFETFGHVDVLMNNAGTSERTGSFSALDQWRHLVEVNMWGIIHGVQAFTQPMIDQNRPGLIINTGSKQGITNPPGNPAYNVSKAGVKAATECLQHELRNIKDCSISAHLLVPGYTYTGLTKRHSPEKPAGAWAPNQVVDYLLDGVNRGSFYIICPDNEVSSEDDAKRILWAAGDIAQDRTPLSRWDPDYADAYLSFKPPK